MAHLVTTHFGQTPKSVSKSPNSPQPISTPAIFTPHSFRNPSLCHNGPIDTTYSGPPPIHPTIHHPKSYVKTPLHTTSSALLTRPVLFQQKGSPRQMPMCPTSSAQLIGSFSTPPHFHLFTTLSLTVPVLFTLHPPPPPPPPHKSP